MAATHSARAFSEADVIDGFRKTVFGSEFGQSIFYPNYVRKFSRQVRFHVVSSAGADARSKVEKFVLSLERLIAGLDVKLVNSRKQASFVVHVVKRRDYESTVQKQINGGRSNPPARGRCMVRAIFSRSGISRADAVIVADEGPRLLSRCMTEEILQGLGPLNDDATLQYSMFNDTSPYRSFQRFDRLILNMLYDSRVKAGMRESDVAPLLPALYKRAAARMGH